MTHVDVAIIGAGPAGSSAAIALHQSGISAALIDKASFPRDKICGDALSPDVVSQLAKMPLHESTAFEDFQEKIWCNAVRFISPNYRYADLRLNQPHVTGYVSPRIDFDNYLFQRALRSDAVLNYTGKNVQHISRSKDGVEISLNRETIRAKIVLGADGAHSLVKRTFSDEKIDKKHYCAGLRWYFEGVTGFSDDNAVELHFYKELLPGYFWIFPLPNNRANVGLGMLSTYVSKRKADLKSLLNDIVSTHPNVRDRFLNAHPVEDIKGFGLPLGSKKRQLSGDNFLLLGDAASLINPLSGEGIANAIRSGRVAAEHIISGLSHKQYNARFNKAYDQEVYRRMWGELRLNYWIQLAMRNPSVCNLIVKRAIGNKWVQQLVLSGFSPEKIFGGLK